MRCTAPPVIRRFSSPSQPRGLPGSRRPPCSPPDWLGSERDDALTMKFAVPSAMVSSAETLERAVAHVSAGAESAVAGDVVDEGGGCGAAGVLARRVLRAVGLGDVGPVALAPRAGPWFAGGCSPPPMFAAEAIPALDDARAAGAQAWRDDLAGHGCVSLTRIRCKPALERRGVALERWSAWPASARAA